MIPRAPPPSQPDPQRRPPRLNPVQEVRRSIESRRRLRRANERAERRSSAVIQARMREVDNAAPMEVEYVNRFEEL